MKHNPHTPSQNSPTEQVIARRRPILREYNTQTLAHLVERYGYRTTSILTGCSRGSLWARLRPEQAKVPRGKHAVKTIDVSWTSKCTQATNVTAVQVVKGALRRNLETFLYRAERLGGLSAKPNRKARTVEAHLKRINTALARLAVLHLQHAERALQRVPWLSLPPEDVERVFQCIVNMQQRIVQILAVMLLWRDTGAYQEIPQIYQTNSSSIGICPHTLETPAPRRMQKMTYDKLAAINDTSREKIKKIETKALRKLKRLLQPERDDLIAYLS